MTNREMIDKVEADHKKQSGYSFDSARIVEVIEAGTIPEGTVLTTRGDQTVKFESGKVVVYSDCGKSVRLLDDAKTLQGALMMYAYNESNVGHSMGAI